MIRFVDRRLEQPPARRSTGVASVGTFVVALVLAGCSGSTPDTAAVDSVVAVTSDPTSVSATKGAAASGAVTVMFDSPGSDPRPLREVPVTIDEPTSELSMQITELTYRGVVCGFTFTGERPPSPVTIEIGGTIATGVFSSGPVDISWDAAGDAAGDSAGLVKTGQPQSDNGWSFSADAYPNRNGPGWAVSIGAVTGEGQNVNPSAATCRLRSTTPFVAANGPVGYWAGFATV